MQKPCVASHHLDTCSWDVWRKSIQGKWQKWCVGHVTKTNASATHFFALSPKPIAWFRWKRARLICFMPQSYQSAKFHPNPSKFPRFISENDVPDRCNIRRFADNKSVCWLYNKLYLFQPIAVENLGPISLSAMSFLSNLGQRFCSFWRRQGSFVFIPANLCNDSMF